MAGQLQVAFVVTLASKYGRRLHRFLSKRASNAADVPDLAQEVFLRLLRVQQHEMIRSPEAYLFTIASHVAHQHALRESSAPVAIDVTEALAQIQLISPDDPSVNVETQLQASKLQCALEQLPPKLSTALLLHRVAGLSIEQIANHLGVARPTAKKYLAQALIHCRNACDVN